MCLFFKATYCSIADEDYYDPHMDDAFAAAEAEMKKIREADIRAYDAGVDNMQTNTVQHHAAMFSGMSEAARAMGKLANLQLKTLKRLLKLGVIKSKDFKNNKHFKRGWKKKFQNKCTYAKKYLHCDGNAEYRTLDGTCNNWWYPTLGSAMIPQLRKLPPMYDDGVDTPRQTARDGSPLASARHISNVVFSSPHRSPRNPKLTTMVMQFGQFLDHDFIKTPAFKGEMGSTIDCCSSEDADMYRDQCHVIRIPANDPYFNKSCMNFVRSVPAPDEDCDPGFRNQLNVITSFIDGSAVYGSSDEESMMLRAENGLLKTEGIDQLPRTDTPEICNLRFPAEDWCQRAGDTRANVVPSLGWSHTTFMREHNRIAKILRDLNPQWSDETVFQETRKIIAALIQHITYNEYLSSFLSDRTMRKYKLWSKRRGYANTYKPWVNPSIFNAFGAAVFRHGHSQIANYQARTNLYYNSTLSTPIEQTFHDPHLIQANQGAGLHGVARWLVSDPTPLVDRIFASGIRDKLFETAPGASLDLPALNIQRGRDHGLPSYNYWRKYCNLGKLKSFKKMPNHNKENRKLLRRVYGHVDDIDLYPGAMTEKHLPGSSLGPTFTCLMAEQFRDLKQGDRFWYETPKKRIGFTRGQLNEIKKNGLLAKILCNNYDINEIQPNAFKLPNDRFPNIEPWHDTINKVACASSEDTGLPGQLPSLIRVFAVCIKVTTDGFRATSFRI